MFSHMKAVAPESRVKASSRFRRTALLECSFEAPIECKHILGDANSIIIEIIIY